MKISNAFFLILLAVFSVPTLAQTPAETHQKILRAVAERDYQTAAGELEALKKADRNLFELNNYDYLHARLAEKNGDFAVAAANYQTIVNRRSALREYALWHLAQIARASGNLMLERSFLHEITSFAPLSLLQNAARARLTRSNFESKNYDYVIRQTFGSSAAPPAEPRRAADDPFARENLVLLGEAYLQTGKTNEAREVFTKLISNLSNPAQPDDFALAGARGLDRLETGADFGKAVAALTDLNHLQRAMIYQFNRDFADARLHYQAIVKNHPASGIAPDALYQIGRGYAQEGNYVEAINWFERVLEQFPDHPVAQDALTQAASAYSRVGKPREAVTRYQKFIEKYPDADNIERAYLNIVDVLRDAGEDGDALKWTQKTREVFRGKLPEAIALFAQLRVRLAQTDWQSALADAESLLTFADLGGTRVPGGTNKAEIIFLKGFALENLERFQEALDVYLSIPDGRGEYYGWRATERLKLLAADPRAAPFAERKIEELTRNIEVRNAEAQRKAAQDVMRLTVDAERQAQMLEIVKKAYANLPAYQKVPDFKLLEFGRAEVLREKREPSANYHQNLADELLFLGLYDEGTPELERALEEKRRKGEAEKNPKSEIDFTLAVFYKRGDIAHRAVGFIEPLWRNVPAEYQIELMPREQAELLYPSPYADALTRYASPRGVDPRFELSIMRQESRFRADVKSVAAARGLLQFISTTSNQIARELGRESFRQDELYHPPTAVLFGAQYLANIYKLFPGSHPAVAASYNGGEDNMRRWLARSKSDAPDRYVPEIVFSQSKDYAYKVMANYRVYQILYDENLKAR
ncbi:MAG TPA: transglycosylase SLT domain-containing protein [Pyrinomonadaceae bacterium]